MTQRNTNNYCTLLHSSMCFDWIFLVKLFESSYEGISFHMLKILSDKR